MREISRSAAGFVGLDKAEEGLLDCVGKHGEL
jgi:hypothetical protein